MWRRGWRSLLPGWLLFPSHRPDRCMWWGCGWAHVCTAQWDASYVKVFLGLGRVLPTLMWSPPQAAHTTTEPRLGSAWQSELKASLTAFHLLCCAYRCALNNIKRWIWLLSSVHAVCVVNPYQYVCNNHLSGICRNCSFCRQKNNCLIFWGISSNYKLGLPSIKILNQIIVNS